MAVLFCALSWLSVIWGARGGMTFGRKTQSLVVPIASQAAGTIHPWLGGIWECITVSTVWNLFCAALTFDHFLSNVFYVGFFPHLVPVCTSDFTFVKIHGDKNGKSKRNFSPCHRCLTPTSARNFPAYSVSPDCTTCAPCPVTPTFMTLTLTFIYCKLNGGCL